MPSFPLPSKSAALPGLLTASIRLQKQNSRSVLDHNISTLLRVLHLLAPLLDFQNTARLCSKPPHPPPGENNDPNPSGLGVTTSWAPATPLRPSDLPMAWNHTSWGILETYMSPGEPTSLPFRSQSHKEVFPDHPRQMSLLDHHHIDCLFVCCLFLLLAHNLREDWGQENCPVLWPGGLAWEDAQWSCSTCAWGSESWHYMSQVTQLVKARQDVKPCLLGMKSTVSSIYSQKKSLQSFDSVPDTVPRCWRHRAERKPSPPSRRTRKPDWTIPNTKQGRMRVITN